MICSSYLDRERWYLTHFCGGVFTEAAAARAAKEKAEKEAKEKEEKGS